MRMIISDKIVKDIEGNNCGHFKVLVWYMPCGTEKYQNRSLDYRRPRIDPGSPEYKMVNTQTRYFALHVLRIAEQ
jgi:hypothetical protein